MALSAILLQIVLAIHVDQPSDLPTVPICRRCKIAEDVGAPCTANSQVHIPQAHVPPLHLRCERHLVADSGPKRDAVTGDRNDLVSVTCRSSNALAVLVRIDMHRAIRVPTQKSRHLWQQIPITIMKCNYLAEGFEKYCSKPPHRLSLVRLQPKATIDLDMDLARFELQFGVRGIAQPDTRLRKRRQKLLELPLFKHDIRSERVISG